MKKIWGNIRISGKQALNFLKKFTKLAFNCFWMWFKNSLILCVCKSCFLVWIVLYLLFLIAPTNAHISYKSNDAYSLEAHGYNANMACETNSLEFKCEEKTVLNYGLCYIKANGKVFDDTYQISFVPKKNVYGYSFGNIIVSNDESFTTSLYAAGFNAETVLLWEKGVGQIEIENQREFALSYIDSDVDLKFANGEAFLIKDDFVEKIENCKLISHNYKLTISSEKGLSFFHASGKANINLFSQDELYVDMTSGELNFAYTPEAKLYNLHNQSLSLKSALDRGEINNLNVRFIFDNGKISDLNISGMVNNKSTVSGIDLLPTFRGWFRNNIYMAPITLLTVIMGAIAMFYKKKNPKDI